MGTEPVSQDGEEEQRKEPGWQVRSRGAGHPGLALQMIKYSGFCDYLCQQETLTRAPSPGRAPGARCS